MHPYHVLPIDNNNYKDMFKRYALAIAFYVIVRLKASDYPFGIFEGLTIATMTWLTITGHLCHK
jgi:hypothetical protein